MQMHKEVTVSGRSYRVGRFLPEDGTWIVQMLTTKMRLERERVSLLGAAPAAVQPAPLPAKHDHHDGHPHETSLEDRQAEVAAGMMMTATFLIAQLTREELRDVMKLSLQHCDRMEQPDGSPVTIPMAVMLGSRYAIPEMQYDGPTCLQLTKEAVAFNIVPFLLAND
jgi:hypothetical protein